MAAPARTPSNLPQAQSAPVPQLVTDPVWSLRPWPVEIDLGPIAVTIPALPAADWLAALMKAEPDPDSVFPGLLPSEEEEAVEDLLYSGRLTLAQADQIFLDVVTTVSARPWWVALRLIEVARNQWAIVGAELLLRGVDASKVSLSGWLDAALLTIMRSITPESSTMFTLQLEAPPPSETAAAQGQLEMDAAQFLAMGR